MKLCVCAIRGLAWSGLPLYHILNHTSFIHRYTNLYVHDDRMVNSNEFVLNKFF